jgi:hypothetical protein
MRNRKKSINHDIRSFESFVLLAAASLFQFRSSHEAAQSKEHENPRNSRNFESSASIKVAKVAREVHNIGLASLGND